MTDDETRMLAQAMMGRGHDRDEESHWPLVPLLQRLAQDGRLADLASALDTYLAAHPVDERRIVAKLPGILAGRYFGDRLGSRFHSWVVKQADYGQRIERVARLPGQLEAHAQAILEEVSRPSSSATQ